MGQIVCYGCNHSLDHTDPLRRASKACEACLHDLVSSTRTNLAQYLESLDHPAALLRQDHTVMVANQRFRSLQVDKAVIGEPVGDVLGCMYAPLLGRCGETVACILCSLRRAVETTWLTGTGLREVPMSYPHKAEKRRSVTVTTEKVGHAVLVILG